MNKISKQSACSSSVCETEAAAVPTGNRKWGLCKMRTCARPTLRGFAAVLTESILISGVGTAREKAADDPLLKGQVAPRLIEFNYAKRWCLGPRRDSSWNTLPAEEGFHVRHTG